MTFKQFETTVNHFRNNVKVFKHGDFCNNKSENTLGIIFIKDGKESRVYNFSGTYSEVLNKLNITEFYEDSDINFINNEIERLENGNGKKDLFFGLLIDNSAKIEELKTRLEDMKGWYKIV